MERKRKGRPKGYVCPWAACPRNDDLIRKLAAEEVSLVEIGRRIGTSRQRVREYIRKHQIPYQRKHNHGRHNPSWKGGRIVDKSGYILVHRPDHPDSNGHGYIREHRLVMEEKLGRRLLASEVVHHKDDDKQNNHPDNLELYSTNAGHLAETLKGQIPNWTEDGKERMREGNRQKLKRWWAANLHEKERKPNGTWQKTSESPLLEPSAQSAG